MRKLLSLLIIFPVGIVAFAIPLPEAHYFTISSAFLQDSLIKPVPIQADSIPKIKKGGFILIPRSTKLYDIIFLVLPENELPVENIPGKLVATTLYSKKAPLLKISGNVLYDMNYRSRIDTPYAANDVYQHTVQTRLDLLYKEQYPLKIYFTSRFSNSWLFRNYTDFNIKFNPSDFKRIARQRVMEAAKRWLADIAGDTDSLYHLIQSKRMTVASLRRSLEKTDLKQKIVESREKDFYSKKLQNPSYSIDDVKIKLPDPGSVALNGKSPDTVFKQSERLASKVDTIAAGYNDYQDSMKTQKQIIDSLERELQKLEDQYRKVKAYNGQSFAELKQQIEEEKDAGRLADKLRRLNLPDTILPRGYKVLTGIQSLNIGRSIADYSELSVKNISITGVQAEYNTQYYYAVAAGKVDYRFRDYIVPNHTRSNQHVALLRFGKGTKNGNHVFFTYYTGKRQFFNSSVALQDGRSIPGYHLAGITVEGIYKINRTITVIGEVAKSTMPYYSLNSLQKSKWINALGKFNNRSNEAYALQFLSFFPKTQTRVNGNISYTGANFQSFSTFTTGTAQLRWLARLEQPFFKRQLKVISTVQRNNYSNPFVETAYRSSSVLAGIQANLSIKKYPVVALGLFPSYQLTKTGDHYYSESRYYTLMGSAGYFYTIQQVQLSTYGVYSRFYNAASDSGFVYYNSKNFLVTQSAAWGKYSLVMNGALSDGSGYTMYTLDNTLQVAVNKILSVGGGLKVISYSLLPGPRWGYNGNLTLRIPLIGDIQFLIDKGFIPGINRQLADHATGRLIYYKTF